MDIDDLVVSVYVAVGGFVLVALTLPHIFLAF